MRLSKAFVPTSKETPKDAVLPSHIYLVRGGFIAQVASGIYNFLPLGKIVLEKIKSIIKEELDEAGCQEVQLGFVTPCELWQQSKRFEKYGKELLRFEDRHENCFVLGPTHEEMMVELAKNRAKSYKDLPLNLYQINLKFRDERRPRFGLLRGREFVMKDSYSFHESKEDMIREFNLMEATYRKIFGRMGLDFRVVEAHSGAIGGSGSKEFMVLAESGEDTIVVCRSCDYAANIEAARRRKKEPPVRGFAADFQKIHTPGLKTIEEVSGFFGVDPYFTVKAVAKRALYDDHSEIVVFFVRGSDDLQETKAASCIDANDLADVTEEELRAAGLVAGFLGPVGLEAKFVIDAELMNEKNLITGANEPDFHYVGVDLGLLEGALYADLIEVKEGDSCPCCGGMLYHTKGIEVGHIFQLGTRYSEPLEACFLDQNGKSNPFVMGTYGIGVSRLISAIIEQHHDAKGCIWPKSVAPFAVDIVVSNVKEESQMQFGEELYKSLKTAGIDAVLDDRNERFGFKMNDFELIGFPYAAVVGKALAQGKVEIVCRKSGERLEVAKEEAALIIAQMVGGR